MPVAVPIMVAATVVGAGVSAYGTIKQMDAAKKGSEAQAEIARQQQKAEEVRQRAMELDARRKQMENIRQMQKARAFSLSTATAQGASEGSGLFGAYGQTSGQGNVNALGISQGLQSGQQMFGINSAITDQRINMAGYSAEAAFGAGMSSLGGALVSSAGTLDKFAQGFGSSNKSPGPGWYNSNAWYNT